MQYIKVLATDSTNSTLKKRFQQDKEMSNTCLSAEHQTQGRGQRGASWIVKPGKNLTFSILLKDLNLNPSKNFILSALVSLGLVAGIKEIIQGHDFYIKWPNDILSGDHKICGILLENILRGNQIKHSIIGVGININQTDFKDFPQASSFKNIAGQPYDLGRVLKVLTTQIEKTVYRGITAQSRSTIYKAYEAQLYRKNQDSVFEFPNGERQTGIIKGITGSGRLNIYMNNVLKSYDLKEVKLIY